MRIAWVIDNLKLVGGAQRVLVLFAKSIQSKDIQLTVVSLQEDSTSPVPEQLRGFGAQVTFFRGRNLRDVFRFGRLVRFFRQQKFDVIHTHLYYANILGIPAGRCARTPVVASLHSSRVDHRRFHQVLNPLEAFVLRRWARKVVAVGYTTAREQAHRLGNRAITVIPNAVEIPSPISDTQKDALRKEMIGDRFRTIIITVGRLAEVKGYQHLIQAFDLLSKDHPDAALVLVGSGSLEQKLREQAKSLGLVDSIIFLGARNDVPDLLAASDIYVNSSLWEGLPCTVLEGMAAGLPVVATNVGDNARVVVNGTGLIVPPAQPQFLCEALSRLVAQPSLRQHMGLAARAHVTTDYDLNRWSEQLLNLYGAILPRSSLEFRLSEDY